MHTRMLVLVIFGSALLACGAPFEDEAAVYIMPVDRTCDLRIFEEEPLCEVGSYPEATPFVVVYGIAGSGIEIHDEKCSLEQTGEFELTIHTHWYEQDREDIATETHFDCDDMTPPLAAGTWTIRTGDHTATLEIPSIPVDVFVVGG